MRAANVGAGALFVAALMVSETASAASTIHGTPPKYSLEIEPHLDVQGFHDSGGNYGFGGGLRLSIPLMSPGFVPSINDSVAISFGGDFVRYSAGPDVCGGNVCTASSSFWVAYAPVALQWNFFLTDKWSVFAEPGVAMRHTFVDHCLDCSVDQLRPLFDMGGRYALADGMKLTMRVGFPMLASVGISIF